MRYQPRPCQYDRAMFGVQVQLVGTAGRREIGDMPSQCGRFTLDGVTYEVPVNDGPNSLHGGIEGFDKRVWQASPVQAPDAVGLKLALVSPHGDAGYACALSVEVTSTLRADNAAARLSPHNRSADCREPDQPHLLQSGW